MEITDPEHFQHEQLVTRATHTASIQILAPKLNRILMSLCLLTHYVPVPGTSIINMLSAQSHQHSTPLRTNSDLQNLFTAFMNKYSVYLSLSHSFHGD